MLLPSPNPPYIDYDRLGPGPFALPGWVDEGLTLRTAVFRRGEGEVYVDRPIDGWRWRRGDKHCGMDGFMNPDMAMRAYDARYPATMEVQP